MENVLRIRQKAVSFGRRWGLPVLIGGGSGLAYVVLTLDVFATAFGPVIGGVLASLSGIGLGLLLAVFAALMGRLTVDQLKPNEDPA